MKIKWFLFAFIFIIAIIISLIGLFEYIYSDKYYPGVTIASESVGGKNYSEVSQEFKTKSDKLLNNGLTLVFNRGSEEYSDQKKISIPSSTAGFTPDILVEYFSIGDSQGAVLNAYNFGREGTIIQKFKEQFALLSSKKNFNIPISPHKEAIESLISRETKYSFTKEVPAQFSLDENNKVIIIPEKLGDNADIENIVNTVIQKFNSFEVSQPVVFNIQPKIPYPTEEKLKPFLSLAEQFADSANVNFYYQNHKWQVAGKTLATWLTLKSDNQMTVDNNKLKAFLSASVDPLINDPPQNSRFEMENGNLVETSPGKSGEVVNVDKITALLENNISQMQQSFIATGSISSALPASNSEIQLVPADTIDIPVETITTEPEITQKTINQYKIQDLVGYAKTNFKGGSLNRQHNIEVGVSKITGTLIAPGAEFSTVKAIGDVTEQAGFVKEYVIDGDQTVKELGGGLCQLATTLFRTALNAGLPITERVNHAYVIPYYGPGLDATIYDPHPDFRFVNDTGNYLLLQGTAINNEVTFELYGIADGRRAEVSTPVLSDEKPVPPVRNIMSPDLPIGTKKCQTATHKGITADTTYTVSYPDGSVKEKVFHSVYEPWPEVCLIGTSTDASPSTNTQ